MLSIFVKRRSNEGLKNILPDFKAHFFVNGSKLTYNVVLLSGV